MIEMDYNVLVEVRPLVQACCVYLKVPSPQAHAQLVVQSEILSVSWIRDSHDVLSQTFSLPPRLPVKFQPSAVSSLRQEEKHLSFRIQTTPRDLTGSFSMQLLDSSEGKSLTQNSDDKPSILPNIPCSIECACCSKNILCKETATFCRVLPLPSGPLDASDFFCHSHEDSFINTSPNELDCLYSPIGFHIHPSFLDYKESVIRCKDCFAWIGTTNSRRVCLWNSTVNVRHKSAVDLPTLKLNPACEFILVVEKTIKQSASIACRLVVDVRLKSDVSHFILINVIDRQLTLLSAKSSLSSELNYHTAIKVSYHLERQYSKIVSEWSNDPLVNSIEVSLPVFVQGLKLLSNTSQLIPSTQRKAQHDFLLAYLCTDFIEC